MEPGLLDVVLDRLAADEVESETEDLVLAAFVGEPELEAACEGQTTKATAGEAASPGVAPASAFLRSISVEGFRGVGERTILPLTLGPGLTLVVGRNGAGKSSFAEALELLLTGDNRRWSGRSAVWAEGWRNLHHAKAEIQAELTEEGQTGVTVVTCSWPTGAGLDAGTTAVQRPGSAKESLDSLGWERALEAYRPFLSYNELGSMLDERPSDLYDALSSILGLDDLNEAAKRLRSARLAREGVAKQAKAALPQLHRRLEDNEDERAITVRQAISAKTWNLDVLDAVLAGEDPEGEEDVGTIALLRQLRTLEGPDPELVEGTAADLEAAAAASERIAATDAGQALELARLLEAALHHHEERGDGDCPVCGQAGALDQEWQAAAAQQLWQLKQDAKEANDARQTLGRALDSARRLLSSPPAILERAGEVGIDASTLKKAWDAWAWAPPDDEPTALATHLRDAAGAVNDALAPVIEAAATELAKLDNAWRPVAGEVAAWVASARAAERAQEVVKKIKKAETWLKDAAGQIRDERFAPISDQARALWEMLRQQSSVELGRVELRGATTQRRVALDVTIDGVEGAALSVMSQGELHALALSLFLPRATLPESPFRFVVIDDPVQAMDPARVEGLARVLEATAATRQVIVLTHDERLPEAVRRLGIDAKVIEVARRDASVIEIRPGLHPVKRAILDAMALAQTDDLPPKAAARVVPGICRLALEAAATEVFRRRRLGQGEPHAKVEDEVDAADKLSKRMALALLDDATRTGEVSAKLKDRFGADAVDVFQRCNKGAHQGDAGDLVLLVRGAEKLSEGLLAIK